MDHQGPYTAPRLPQQQQVVGVSLAEGQIMWEGVWEKNLRRPGGHLFSGRGK